MKAGVDVNETTEEGRTALHGAAVAGHVPLIRHLLAAGSDLDIATTRRKLTALHWACRMGHIEAVRALLARGADPMLKNFGDMTASDLAHKAGHTDIVTLLADFSQRDPKAVNEPDLIRG